MDKWYIKNGQLLKLSVFVTPQILICGERRTHDNYTNYVVMKSLIVASDE